MDLKELVGQMRDLGVSHARVGDMEVWDVRPQVAPGQPQPLDPAHVEPFGGLCPKCRHPIETDHDSEGVCLHLECGNTPCVPSADVLNKIQDGEPAPDKEASSGPA